MNMFVMQVSGLVFLWMSMMGITYYMIYSLLTSSICYKKVLNWGLFLLLSALGTAFLCMFLPQHYQDMILIVFNHFTCAAALHAVFLKVNAYMHYHYQKELSIFWRYLFALVLYGGIASQAVFLIMFCPLVIKSAVIMGADYVTRTAVMMYLTLEIKSHYEKPVVVDKPYTYLADEYQDYDGQC